MIMTSKTMFCKYDRIEVPRMIIRVEMIIMMVMMVILIRIMTKSTPKKHTKPNFRDYYLAEKSAKKIILPGVVGEKILTNFRDYSTWGGG